ncbi:hypothetical protein QBC37DRAFT_422747 [Rhypophila decipiens]|uniref:Uncharacterized protein n=1 Tax=Rhypophila decipiens TaxID=261697 RepID=A0AAN7BA52_9PEZI|nr:hypothetical protein QBC37DRAFT_422747 [Rhypophila decipiens]
MSNNNNLPWDMHSSLRRNPSDYYPHRYESRRSIASTSTAGPPPVSPRSGDDNRNNSFFRNSVGSGSPWPIPSAPVSPAPGPPPAISSMSIGYLDENLGNLAQSNNLSSSRGIPMAPTPMSLWPQIQQDMNLSNSNNRDSSGPSQEQQQRLSPLSIPGMGGGSPGSGRISPSSSITSPRRDQVRTPVQRPGSHLSSNSRNPAQTRASMEAEFAQKHALLVEQARLLLAEMKTLQVLGPVHSAAVGTQNTGNNSMSSDDGTNSSVFLQSQSGGDDTSSYLSGSNSTNPNNNTAIYYEQDDVGMSALGAILQGKLGSVVSRPPPRPARAIAREVLARLGGITVAASTGEPNDEGEAEVVELLMEDYEAVLNWARSSSSFALSSPRLSSSGASSSSASQGGQTQTQVRIQTCLADRQALLEAALPAYLAHLPSEAMMHFCHEKLFVSSSSGRARTPSASVHSGHTGTGLYANGNGNSNLSVNGHSSNNNNNPRNNSSLLPTQTYTNSHTFREGLAIEEIPRRRFLKTEDNYAWDMLELASALESDLLLSSSSSGNSSRGRERGNMHMPPSLRNPVTRSFFTPDDVSRILAHPMGRSLGPYPVERIRDPSPPFFGGVRPVSPPVPLPESVAAFQQQSLNLGQSLNQEPQGERSSDVGGAGIVGARSPSDGIYRPRLYGHDEEPEPADLGRRDNGTGGGDAGGLDIDWSAPPPPPYRSLPEPREIPRSPASPPPPIPTTTTRSNPDSSYLPPYSSEPLRLRPYSPPSSPPSVLGAVTENMSAITSNENSQNNTQQQDSQDQQHLPEPVPPLPVQVPMPRPLPGSYPEEREHEHENDEPSNPDFVSSNSRYELLASPTSSVIPVPTITRPSSTAGGGRSPTPPRLNPMSSRAGLIQEIANGLAAIPIPSTAVTNLNDPASGGGGEYRSALLGNLRRPNPTSATSLPSSPAIVSSPMNMPLPPRPLSTNVPASTGTGTTGRRQFRFSRPSEGASAAAAGDDDNVNSTTNTATKAPETKAATTATSWEARERERQEEERTKWANNDYLSGSYGVATPPPSGPIPVSSLNAAAASTSSEPRYSSGYFSLGASHRNIPLEQSQSRPGQYQPYQAAAPREEQEETDQVQRGRWETRERERERDRAYYAASLSAGDSHGYGRSAATNNPFASSRDPSAHGRGPASSGAAASAFSGTDEDWWRRSGGGWNSIEEQQVEAPPPSSTAVQFPTQMGEIYQPQQIAEMDAGPFELGDAPPRLPELSGVGVRRRRAGVDGDDDDDDDAHSREWMGELSAARR